MKIFTLFILFSNNLFSQADVISFFPIVDEKGKITYFESEMPSTYDFDTLDYNFNYEEGDTLEEKMMFYSTDDPNVQRVAIVEVTTIENGKIVTKKIDPIIPDHSNGLWWNYQKNKIDARFDYPLTDYDAWKYIPQTLLSLNTYKYLRKKGYQPEEAIIKTIRFIEKQ